MDRIARVLDNVELIPFSSCWIYTGSIDTQGYGRIHVSKAKRPKVHRLVYEYYRGPIPNGLTIDHLCRVRCCCNPDHMEPVTGGENARRGISHSKSKTHCPKGHEYAGENLSVDSKGHRRCKTCGRDNARRYRL